ncbi:MAG: ATP-dependent zinc metalloprotease FtsH [Clostridia bacterium]|nr:ATP-dependent zinc metalloprotease FtsH [Clostridia bacterium]
MKANFKSIIALVALVLVFVLAATLLSDIGGDNDKKYEYSDLVFELKNDLIGEFKIDGNTITVSAYEYSVLEGADGTLKVESERNKLQKKKSCKLAFEYQVEYVLQQAEFLQSNGSLTTYSVKVSETPWYIQFLPYIIIFVIFIFFWFFMMRQATGRGGRMNTFARANAKLGSAEKNPVKFDDVAGADEEKKELEEVVEFLKDPGKFTRLGARIPRGILLVGPPGTGKTLLSKAVAGEAGVPFFSISGSDFVEMYVGVGASRVRDLFETARKSPASIIFIDEIDAVGRHRGAGLGGGHDEREQTLNQLLVEMDGFGKHEGVIVMAATNRPDILDPALLRPGRFDRQITVSYPDLKGREEILQVHARNKPLEGDVDLKKIAQTTVGFTGADLANLLNEAALLAARDGKHLIGMSDIENATLKVMVGTEKKNLRITEAEKKKTAYHEAGHAILAHALPSQDPVRRISIIPSGNALGYTLNPPTKDRYSVYKSELNEQISMLLGGRVAEAIVFGDVSGGASNDIQRATAIARNMVTKYGMSDLLGAVRFGGEHSSEEVFLGRDFNSGVDYSQETAAKIDAEIKRIIDEAYARAEEILREHREKLDFIAEFLVKHEVMEDDLFAAVMEKDATMEELEAMMEEKRTKSAEANAKAKRAAEERERREAERKEKEAREALGESEESDEASDDTPSDHDEKTLD